MEEMFDKFVKQANENDLVYGVLSPKTHTKCMEEFNYIEKYKHISFGISILCKEDVVNFTSKPIEI